jgi:acetyl-CoA carboxylase biotin carboxylase subunit
MFKKILIANRGEIALRIIRACRELGIISVAVYSEADRAALHVLKADEAYLIGPAAATESYLNQKNILEAAQLSGADAVHPGYGFLSENAEFAQASSEAGFKFIGPTAAAMRRMGSKTRARQALENAGVRCVPGTSHGLESREEAERVAQAIGYPVMLKAAAGGGGKGMRLVDKPENIGSALDSARSEALRAFGDSEVYIEKVIAHPRHIEMQILADEYGNTVYLGERECSIQRRHQKVLEEAPSTAVNPQMRQKMGEIAVRVAKAAGYTNAGTIEFLLDQHKNFYFLEMNARLQVEHPVTELVTGLDLVHLQIRIAAGEKLPFVQDDIQFRGHAIECRIYAEDPDNNYFPSPGNITALACPAGPGIRLDSGIYQGWTVPIEYDPLLAKLIGYGTDREQAIAQLRRALGEYFVGGIKTNLSLFRSILDNDSFRRGEIDTHFLNGLAITEQQQARRDHAGVAALAAGLFAMFDGASDVNANGARRNAHDRVQAAGASNWRRQARSEALR